ncbi:MAG: hypothetical protein NZ528_00805 [Caldilineales bacterium]|nr:hypothetical protein [Caldilineales bacterium]MDW8316462.1 hypothetical protein [Anaerolineae bacterium]
MVTQAARELFALLNLLAGAGLFLILVAYVLFARPVRAAFALLLLLVVLLCAVNAAVVYFLV